MKDLSFSEQLARSGGAFTATERRVVEYLLANRESAIIASAADLARAIGTSDATVIRTARKLGFSGLDGLRRALAGDLKRDLSLSERLENSLRRAGGEPADALGQTIATLRASLDGLAALPEADFDAALQSICLARQVAVFGIGPSGYIAGYFAAQLRRMGVGAIALSHTGLQFADDLHGLQQGDTVVALAYDRPYPEITALFDRATELSLASVLITSPGPVVPDYRAGVTLRVARGSRDGFSLHAATLSLIEALLVAYAGRNRDKVRESLQDLNRARQSLSGRPMDL